MSNFVWQAGAFAQNATNRLGWRGRRKQMALAGARMSSADLVRAKTHHAGPLNAGPKAFCAGIGRFSKATSS
jgi:hypothetical protein